MGTVFWGTLQHIVVAGASATASGGPRVLVVPSLPSLSLKVIAGELLTQKKASRIILSWSCCGAVRVCEDRK